jgi:hypothetical protein
LRGVELLPEPLQFGAQPWRTEQMTGHVAAHFHIDPGWGLQPEEGVEARDLVDAVQRLVKACRQRPQFGLRQPAAALLDLLQGPDDHAVSHCGRRRLSFTIVDERSAGIIRRGAASVRAHERMG